MHFIWQAINLAVLLLTFNVNLSLTGRVIDNKDALASGCIFAGCTCGNYKSDQSDETDDYEDPFFQETIIKCKSDNPPAFNPRPSDFPRRIKTNTNTTNPIAILDMSQMELTNVPGGQLAHLAITIADFSNNSIIALDQDAFANVARLEVLDLSSNRLSEIREGTLVPVHDSLVQLSLKSNELSQMMDARLSQLFTGLSKLRLLYLDRNGFTSLPDLSAMTKIEDLSLCHNKLDSLVDPISGSGLLPPSLRYLQVHTHSRT
jgi:hypothetical protein